MSELLNVELTAVPESVPDARGAITRVCEGLRIEKERTEDIRLAVSEACTNCVLHSHGGDAEHATLALEALLDGRTLLITVHDSGGGIVRGPARLGGLGLGLQLIDELADSADVSSRPGGGMRVAMRFALV